MKLRLIIVSSRGSERHDIQIEGAPGTPLGDFHWELAAKEARPIVQHFCNALRTDMPDGEKDSVEWSVHEFAGEDMLGETNPRATGKVRVVKLSKEEFLTEVQEGLVACSIGIMIDDDTKATLIKHWQSGHSPQAMVHVMFNEFVGHEKSSFQSFAHLLGSVTDTPLLLPWRDGTAAVEPGYTDAVGVGALQLEALRLILVAQNRTNELLEQLVERS